MHNVLHPIGLPVVVRTDTYGNPVFSGEVIRKEPGDTITDEEWAQAGQTEEDLQSLEDSGAVEVTS